jgi:hypothetical protein
MLAYTQYIVECRVVCWCACVSLISVCRRVAAVVQHLLVSPSTITCMQQWHVFCRSFMCAHMLAIRRCIHVDKAVMRRGVGGHICAATTTGTDNTDAHARARAHTSPMRRVGHAWSAARPKHAHTNACTHTHRVFYLLTHARLRIQFGYARLTVMCFASLSQLDAIGRRVDW